MFDFSSYYQGNELEWCFLDAVDQYSQIRAVDTKEKSIAIHASLVNSQLFSRSNNMMKIREAFAQSVARA